MAITLDLRAFGKNDIRGIYGEDVTEELFYYAGKGYIRFIEENTDIEVKNIWVTVTRDVRLSSDSLTKSLIKGVVSTGANVLNLGEAPTPIGYYSEFAPIPSSVIGAGKVNGRADCDRKPQSERIQRAKNDVQQSVNDRRTD